MLNVCWVRVGSPQGASTMGRLSVVRRFLLLGLLAAAVAVLMASVSAASPKKAGIKHVLLISIDGLHQSDLDWYVAHHPSSTLAKLIHTGSEYTNASTSNPSDSDPG